MALLPIIAILAMLLFIIFKLKKHKKSNSDDNDEFIETVNFCIIFIMNEDTDGMLEAYGIVKNDSIAVGDVFRIVDKDDNIIDNNVIVKKIDAGAIKHKYIDEVSMDEQVTLVLLTHMSEFHFNGEWFLKK